MQVHVGQCGLRVGASFWQQLCSDHLVSDSGLLLEESPERSFGLHRYFQEEKHSYRPRALLVDLQSQAIDSLQASPQSRLFLPDQYRFDLCGSHNIYPLGYYNDLSTSALEGFRQQAESCDFLSDLHMTMSVGGGTGAGLGTKLLIELKTEYIASFITTFVVIPAVLSDVVVEPYNFILAFHLLMDSSDISVIADNDALNNHLNTPQPSIYALNTALASAMSTITSGTRFRGYLNGSSLRKLSTSLMPMIRLRCLTLAHCPMPGDLSPAALDASLFSAQSCLASVASTTTDRFGAAVMFRGDISTYEAETALGDYQRQGGWNKSLPDHISIAYCSVPADKGGSRVAALVNSAGICPLLTQRHRSFQRLFQRKAFLRPYLEAGMEEMEFYEAESHYLDIVSEYSMWADEWGQTEGSGN